MAELRIESVSDPFNDPESALAAFALVTRAEAMGLIPEVLLRQRTISIDRQTIHRLMETLRGAGLASTSSLRLPTASSEGVVPLLRLALDALDASPYPPGEWEALREMLGDQLLARMLGISESSIRRYAAGGRPTPDQVAWRLHAIGGIVSALRGSYNEYGVRRWFDRVRTALAGRTPAEIIAESVSEDEAGLRQVIELAEALRGAGVAA